MADSAVNNSSERKTKLTFNDVVIKKIVGAVISDVDGILGLNGNLFTNFTGRFRDNDEITKGIDVELGTKQTAVKVTVICQYGVNISALFDQTVQQLKETIHSMTGMDLVEFSMKVDDIMTREEYIEKYRVKEEQTSTDTQNT